MKYITFLLLIPVFVFAQSSSENFILTKSVIDAGGGASSSANFNQVSAFGQPSPLGLQSSESFILSPGFLNPQFLVSPLSPIQELVIKQNQPNVNLWWERIPGAVTYRVYRDTLATFTPSPANLLDTVTDTLYTDINVIPGLQPSYFYIIRSNSE
jgi:hypothetical protein